jgi:hypothetical protein
MPGLGQLHRDHRWKVIDLAMRYSKEPAMAKDKAPAAMSLGEDAECYSL